MAKVVFRRRMEFHVTNTFLQTFFLIWVGYLSLYFELDNFTDRIMVTLTTMLVVATVMSSISSVRVTKHNDRDFQRFISELAEDVLLQIN